MNENGTLAVAMAIAGVLGGACTKLFDWWMTRDKTKYEQQQQLRRDALLEYQDLLQRHTVRIEQLEKRNDDCEKRNDEAEKRNAELGRQQERDHARIQYLEEALTRAEIPFRRAEGTDNHPILPPTKPNEGM